MIADAYKQSAKRQAEEDNLMKEKINGFTFYYNPAEIALDAETREFLANFRTEDGEDCFVLTRDETGLVIY